MKVNPVTSGRLVASLLYLVAAIDSFRIWWFLLSDPPLPVGLYTQTIGMLSVLFEDLKTSWAFLAHTVFSLIAIGIAVILVERRRPHERIPQFVVYVGFAMALVSVYRYWPEALMYALATMFVVDSNREASVHAANNSLQARRP